jgi:putative ABC transport system permease protein
MFADLRFALRTLAKSPAFTIAAILCLTLGIGVNATIFSRIRAMLLRPFPYKDPDALVAIGESNLKRGWHMNSVSYPNFRSWQDENRTLESVGVYQGSSYNLATGDGADWVQGGRVSWTMFHVLGIAPALGRDFREEDDRVGSAKTIMLSDRIWRDRFEAKASVLGQTIMADGVPHVVIGVMPPGFEFPGTAAAWTTMQTDPVRNRGNHSWQVMGRLRPNVTIAQARQDLARIGRSLEEQYPATNGGWGVDVETIRDQQVGDIRPVLWLMMASVAFVLLIACANVANLLLARAGVRAKEMAVRVAMGASSWQVVRQMLTESLIIALAGATLGIGFAYGFLQWIKANLLTGIPFWMRFEIDWQVLVFTVAVAVVTAFVFGLVPALQASRPDLVNTLRDAGGRGTSAGKARQRLRSGLVVAEISLSVVLLVGAALLIRSFMGMQSVKPGFDPGNLLTMRVSLAGPQYDSTYKRAAFWDRFLADVNSRPGVVAAAITNNVPLGGGNNNSFFVPEGQVPQPGSEPLLEIRWVSPRYLDVLRVPILRGRMFSEQEWADSGAAGRVAVINEYMAKQFWKTPEGALGKRFTFGYATDTLARWITVVGVAADIKHKRLTQEPDFQGYMPYRQGGWSGAAIMVRTLGAPTRATPTVMAALKAVDPYTPAYRVLSMEETIQRSYWQQSLYSKMFTAFAAIALALAAVGVYGVIAYSVAQRTREIGVRVALGAQRGNVLHMVLGDGAVLAAFGVAIGLVGALFVTRFMRSMLYGVSPFDPISFVAVATILSAIAFVASYVPARRAAKVDPIVALREE